MAKRKKSAVKAAVPLERITNSILLIRGQKVMLDADLATLYGVETKVLNQAMKRNADRFPQDFMFSADGQGVPNLEVTICDLKFEVTTFHLKFMGRATLSTLRFCRAGRSDAFRCFT